MKYIGIFKEHGEVIESEDAFDYAIERISKNEIDKAEFKKEFGDQFVEWFFSGNFVRKDDSKNA